MPTFPRKPSLLITFTEIECFLEVTFWVLGDRSGLVLIICAEPSSKSQWSMYRWGKLQAFIPPPSWKRPALIPCNWQKEYPFMCVSSLLILPVGLLSLLVLSILVAEGRFLMSCRGSAYCSPNILGKRFECIKIQLCQLNVFMFMTIKRNETGRKTQMKYKSYLCETSMWLQRVI